MSLEQVFEEFPKINEELSKSYDCKKSDYQHDDCTKIRRNVKLSELVVSKPYFIGNTLFTGIGWSAVGPSDAYLMINVDASKPAIESFCEQYQKVVVKFSDLKVDVNVRSFRGLELVHKSHGNLEKFIK